MNESKIYLDVDTDLATTLDKLSKVSTETVELVIPKGSVIFHSAINLKIIKSELADRNISLSISTSDLRGQKLASKISETDEGAMEESTDSEPQDQVEIPIVHQSTPPTSSAKPANIQYKRKALKSDPAFWHHKTVSVSEPVSEPEIGRMESSIESIKRIGGAVNRHAWAIFLIAVAVLVLGGVGYFIIPHATVHLDVKAQPFTNKFKLVLADKTDTTSAGQNVFKGRFIEIDKEITQTFPATGTKNSGEPASGSIVVYNYTKVIQGIIVNTRFVAPDGAVFRSQRDVLISPGRGSGNNTIPGRAAVEIKAETGGAKNNWPSGTKFTIPGLGSAGTDLVFGKNEEALSGGTDNENKIVTESDIASARESISKNIFIDINEQLHKKTTRREEIVDTLIQNDVIDAVPSAAAGSVQDSFDLRIQVRSWTLLPDKNKLSQMINSNVSAVTPPDSIVTLDTFKNAKLTLDNADFLTKSIDFSVELIGSTATKIDQKELVGSLSNRSPESVGKLLDSMTDIISHRISLWPSWLTRLPILENNIKLDFSYINSEINIAPNETSGN